VHTTLTDDAAFDATYAILQDKIKGIIADMQLQ
jgi:hypothetical protein